MMSQAGSTQQDLVSGGKKLNILWEERDSNISMGGNTRWRRGRLCREQ